TLDRRELRVAVQCPRSLDGVVEVRAGDVGGREELDDRLRHHRQQADEGLVEQRHGRGGLREGYESRMRPRRAALTSATASGKSTRMASRRASACSSTE